MSTSLRAWNGGVVTLVLVSLASWCFGSRAEDVLTSCQVPDGFTVEIVAEPPLVMHPMWACFDERGRLFVAESAGFNLKAEDLLKNPPSSILLLEDPTGSGRFDKSHVFADKMVFPQGVCWHDGALYVASSPSLWRLRDTKGSGTADERTELVTKFGFTGNAADIHGPVLGPDGRLYWCDGRHGHHIVKPDGTVMEGKAARIFRCKPDGTDIEAVCGGGMDNPVKVAFTDEGEPLASCNIVHSRPQRIDGILYALDGAVFPWNEVLNEFKSTGELFEPVDDLGWVAVAGIARYRSNVFGEAFRGNLFSAQFNPHRIQRHIITRDGAGFRLQHENFLTSSDPDFHPTDVVEDADGSLLVVDTGGWFRIGCPNSRIAKPQITGAIYRIRRMDAPPVVDARGLKIAWNTATDSELIKLLDDARPFVVDRAIDVLANRGAAATPKLAEAIARSSSATVRRNALWALTRIDAPQARSSIRSSFTDVESTVRQVAVRSAGLWRDAGAVQGLINLLQDKSPQVRREAATALGRIGDAQSATPLLSSLHGNSDRFLEHAIIYALIQIKSGKPLTSGLSAEDPAVRKGSLIALDQINSSSLQAEQVLPLLGSADPSLRSTAMAIVAHHTDWGDRCVDVISRSLRDVDDPAHREALRGELDALSSNVAVQHLVSMEMMSGESRGETRLLLLEVIGDYPNRPLPADWIHEIGRALSDENDAIVRQAVICARSGDVTTLDAELLELARNEHRALPLRVDALSIVSPRIKSLDPAAFELLCSALDPAQPPLVRMAAADALGRSRLDSPQLSKLTDRISTAGPMELTKLIGAFDERAEDEQVNRLLAALSKSPVSKSLQRADVLRLVEHHSPAVRDAAQPLLRQLSTEADQQKAHLAELEPALSGGDIARGRELFFGVKAACSTCHTVAGRGGHVGPDLSKIGSIRAPRDLLESIVYPSASFARGYEPYLIRRTDGDVDSGIISRETADALELTTGASQVKRIAKNQIKEIRPSPVSVMPQGFGEQLSKQELADVIAFVAAQK